MNKRFVFTLITLAVIIATGIAASFLAKGYTFSTEGNRIVGTGIITVSSVPEGASVYIDGHLTAATNATVPSLPLKSYDIKIIKEGFIPWEKKVQVKEGIVSEIKATLFPAIPTIYPLTFNGVLNPVLSPDGQKLAFLVPESLDSPTRQKGGVWVWMMSSQPISFSRGVEPHQVVASTSSLDFSQGLVRWSPDSKQVLATVQESNLPGDLNRRTFLLSFDQKTQPADLRDITPTVGSLIKDWEIDQKNSDQTRVLALKNLEIQKVASTSAVLLWSPDETKFISGNLSQKASDGKAQPTKTASNIQGDVKPLLTGFKVYDITDSKSYDLPEALAYKWLPDSKHVILIQDNKIAISEFDGTNPGVIYAGGFENLQVFPWPDSSRLAVVTSHPTPTASFPNLFGINLK